MNNNFTLKEQDMSVSIFQNDNILITIDLDTSLPNNYVEPVDIVAVEKGRLFAEPEFETNPPVNTRKLMIDDTQCTHRNDGLNCGDGTWSDLKHFQNSLIGKVLPDPSLIDDILKHLEIYVDPANFANNTYEINYDIIGKQEILNDITHNGEVKHSQPVMLKKADGSFKNLNEHIFIDSKLKGVGNLLTASFDGDNGISILNKDSTLFTDTNPLEITKSGSPNGAIHQFKYNFKYNLPLGWYKLTYKIVLKGVENIDIKWKTETPNINGFNQERDYHGNKSYYKEDTLENSNLDGKFLHDLDAKMTMIIAMVIHNNNNEVRVYTTIHSSPTYVGGYKDVHKFHANNTINSVASNAQIITDWFVNEFCNSTTQITPFEIEMETDPTHHTFITFDRLLGEGI